MKTPDITPAQLGALVVFVCGQLVSWGLLSAPTEKLVIAASTTVIAAVWKLADAYIRHGRSAGAGYLISTVEDSLFRPTTPAKTAPLASGPTGS